MNVPAPPRVPGAGQPGADRPMVLAEGLHKRFGRLEVLRGIDFQVARQEVVCIIGPSGSGKSTLLRCVNHLEKINAGRLWVDGELVGYRQRGDRLYELREREICAKRAEIGMVFQQFNLFPRMTVLENVKGRRSGSRACPGPRRSTTPSDCWTARGYGRRRPPTPSSFPAGSSSGSRSPGRSPCSRS